MNGLPFYNRLSIVGALGLFSLIVTVILSSYLDFKRQEPVREAKERVQQQLAMKEVEATAAIRETQLRQEKRSMAIPVVKVDATLSGYPVDMSRIEAIDACTDILNEKGQQIGAAQNGTFYKGNFCK